MEKTICFVSWKAKGLRGGVWRGKGAKGVEVGTARMCRKIQGLRLKILSIISRGLKTFILCCVFDILQKYIFYDDEVQEEV